MLKIGVKAKYKKTAEALTGVAQWVRQLINVSPISMLLSLPSPSL